MSRHISRERTSCWFAGSTEVPVRQGAEAHSWHCREQWDTAGPLRAFGIRTSAGKVLAGTADLRFTGGLGPGQVNVAYGLYPSWRGRALATRAVLLASRYAATERRRRRSFRSVRELRIRRSRAARTGTSWTCARTVPAAPVEQVPLRRVQRLLHMRMHIVSWRRIDPSGPSSSQASGSRPYAA